MNAASAPQGNNRSHPQQPGSSNDPNNTHHLSPQEAARRGASLAFSKQQQQQQQQTKNTQRQSLGPSPNLPAPISPRDNGALTAATSASKNNRSPTGSVSGRPGNNAARQSISSSNGRLSQQTTGSGNGRLSRQTTGSSTVQEREESDRERERLAVFLSSPGSEQSRSPYLLLPAAGASTNNNKAAGPRSASFIAATLAASRSASPSPVVQGGVGGGDNGSGMRRLPLGEPAHIRRGGSVGTSSSDADRSTTSLDDLPDTTSLEPTTSLISMFEASKRGVGGDPDKTSPDHPIERKVKPPKPKKALAAFADKNHVAITRPENADRRQSSDQGTPALPLRKPSSLMKVRPEVPRKSIELPERPALKLQRPTSRPFVVSTGADGHDSSKPTSPEGTVDARPSSSGSVSSNDSFVSASSTPTRAESPPVYDPASRSLVPRPGALRPASTQPPTPTLSVQRTAAGSSQLTLDSLSNAIMAGSLASARHTPISTSSERVPPPPPPSRRKGSKPNAANRIPSPHRMKQTLRQPRSHSDDEEERKPHHKKKLINNKKHTHHEGSRSRWRNEITEREKKRYEAVWASNRGMFLVQSAHHTSSDPEHPTSWHNKHEHEQEHEHEPVVRTERHEELSDYVPNVIVRDLWSRSRLPGEELAEVWDLVYGRLGRVPAALNKPEFVVGMWLIDQRLRGRKIPTRVSDSVWDSAKGLRGVWNLGHGHGHGHGHSKGKSK